MCGNRFAAGEDSPNIAMLRQRLLQRWAGLHIAGIAIEDLEHVREGTG
jgi:hypothetical protein